MGWENTEMFWLLLCISIDADVNRLFIGVLPLLAGSIKAGESFCWPAVKVWEAATDGPDGSSCHMKDVAMILSCSVL